MPGYLEQLKALAARLQVADRIAFEGPVQMTDLVAAARAFDIGLMALPGHSAHTRHALPNKLFEYMMAGLAIGVTDLEEMTALLSDTGAGFSLGDGCPQAITAALNALNRADIDRMRGGRAGSREALQLGNRSYPSSRPIWLPGKRYR